MGGGWWWWCTEILASALLLLFLNWNFECWIKIFEQRWTGAELDKINLLSYNHLCYMSGLCFKSIFQQRSTTYLPRKLSKFKVWKLVKEWIMLCSTIQSCLFPTCHSKVYHQTGLQKHLSNNLSNLQLS